MISKGWWGGVGFKVWYLKTGNILRKFFDCTCIDRERRWKVGGQDMASEEREPIMGIWGRAACGVQGQSPWSGGQGAKPPWSWKPFSFYSTSESGNFYRIRKWQLFGTQVSSFHASKGTATHQDNKLNTKNRCKPMREEVRGQTTLLDPDFQK